MAFFRAAKALSFIDRSGDGLEIGPSYNPIAPKSAGFHVTIVDHAPTGDLREKFQAYGLGPELLAKIEEVDFVWDGGPLTDLLPTTYDFIIAAHVLEHSVDVIAFLADCESLLKPGGTLSLVLPDKRYCFDVLQPLSTVGRVLDAHLAPTRFHTAGTVLDHFAYAMSKDQLGVAWYPGAPGQLAPQFSDWDAAADPLRIAMAQDEYFDVHKWRFTPASFSLLLQDLRQLGHTRLVEVGGFPTHGYEFFTSLRLATGDEVDQDRAELLARVQTEALQADVVADVTQWATGSRPAPSVTTRVRNRLRALRRPR